MNDLLQATGYAAIVYFLFNYIVTFGSGKPLVEWINPGRRYLPLLAMAMFGGAFTSLRVAALRHQEGKLELLIDLIGQEKAKPEVVGAISFLIFGLAVMMTYLWCWVFIPRSPQTFNPNPRDLISEFRRALKHYVRWKGGLEYAILCEIREGELKVIAEGTDNKAILRGLNRLPGVHAPIEGDKGEQLVDEQKAIWQKMAIEMYSRWPELDQMVLPARQGRHVGMGFDLRYGAIYVELMEDEPAGPGSPAVGVFLFSATLNQHEVANLTAVSHFSMLCHAIRHIRSGVAKG